MMHARSSIASHVLCVYLLSMKNSKRPQKPEGSDALSKLITDMADGRSGDRIMTDDGRDLVAVLLGRRGGLKGGKARAEALSSERRSEIAKRAAAARWSKE